MKLRGQLLIAAALIALLPLTAFLFLGPIERLLRAGHEQAVAESAAAAASLLRASDVLPEPLPNEQLGTPVLYRHAASGDRMLDGYADDWHGLVQQVAGIDGGSVHARPADALDEGIDPVRVAALETGHQEVQHPREFRRVVAFDRPVRGAVPAGFLRVGRRPCQYPPLCIDQPGRRDGQRREGCRGAVIGADEPHRPACMNTVRLARGAAIDNLEGD